MDASVAPSATSYNPNPPIPAYSDTVEWVEAYFTIHVASDPSRRYSYYLWILVGLIFFVVAFLHITGSSTGLIGAYWNKWALRRRTLRKRHARIRAWKTGHAPQPYSLPPNGQILSLVALLFTTLALCFIGPDYIFPGAGVTDFRRDTTYSPSTFFPFQPHYTIGKAWWTSGDRTGTIAFALFPLCILFGLKQPPFAIFAIPFTIQFHFDKLVWLHRWTGRFIWFIATLHVGLWSVQLLRDRRDGTGIVAYHYAWLHINFIYGWLAFGFLTCIILFSVPPIRTKYYEYFYALHVLLIPLTLIFSALHHPPIQWWCWTALALWGGERLWRAGRWLFINNFGRSKLPSPTTIQPRTNPPNPEQWEMNNLHPRDDSKNHRRSLSDTSVYKAMVPYARVAYAPPPGFAHAQVLSGRTIRLTFTSPGYFSWAPGQHFLINVPYISKLTSHPFTCASICDKKAPGDSGRVITFLIRAKGGWTKDLWNTVVSLGAQFKTHAPGEKPPAGVDLPTTGVLLKMFVDGPFGSSARARWGSHSTVLIVAGGSGVSFGLAVLEYVCLCLAGRDGEQLGGRSSGWGGREFLTTRVRFVWLVREFAHIQWCASILRRCLSLVPAPGLQIDIFVTNFKTLEHERAYPAPKKPRPTSSLSAAPTSYAPVAVEDDQLLPPTPRFARQGRDSRSSSVSSIPSANSSVESFVDMNPITEQFGDEEQNAVDLGVRENYTLDLTNFEGDDDDALPGEDALSRRVKKQGKILRAKTRKAQKAAMATREGAQRPIGPADQRPAQQKHLSQLSSDGTMSPNRRVSGHFEVDLGNLSPERSTSPRPQRQSHRLSALSPDPTQMSRLSTLSVDPTQISPLVEKDWDAKSMVSVVEQYEGLKLEVEDDEMTDVNIVAECARPGKPKMERILADEVENSQGSVIVGCCGPSSLNAIVRRSIALQIDPSRIRQGDMRGSIALVSEEFAY